MIGWGRGSKREDESEGGDKYETVHLDGPLLATPKTHVTGYFGIDIKCITVGMATTSSDCIIGNDSIVGSLVILKREAPRCAVL